MSRFIERIVFLLISVEITVVLKYSLVDLIKVVVVIATP